ncbi:hypothetical protein DB30_06346 [Enhygromyxa salina]|uniref:Peptidase C14 caspase domain-containing protein n=1 Tax=Enhygromyxa salina TaxID=215803 RepID=A0A0C2CYR6_9BACT|nr:caspase family protein [Enhygromyxa salina]KIG14760.1 hypothetical protein DB30_06346 [Enhygromyxa salina]
MRRALERLLLALIAVVGCWAVGLDAAQAADPTPSTVRRFALLVGANDGGGDRELLRYASTDAAMLSKALIELGGLDKGDRVVLDNPHPAALEQGFADIGAKIRQAHKAGERVQFVFYYSGHSDEAGLLLAGVHVDYKRLRALIDKVPADVRIGILDSCSSGAFTRFKGGKKQAPFLVGSSAEVQGHAYLTSSSADEAAQESDRIGGSFFTHFLVTGLRGAADFDGDRRVTLNEAYRFAFDETLARTETTSGGPQHAAYDIQLAGTGDLVMTDLRKTSAKLEISGAVSGRIYVRDRRGNLVAELFKPKGAGPITLALEPGNYAITIDDGHNLHRAEVEVRSGKTETLEVAGLVGIPLEGTRLRGDPVADPRGRPPPPLGGYREVPFNIGVSRGSELNTAHRPDKIRNRFSVSLGATHAAAIDGFQLGIGAVGATDYVNGVQAAVGAAVSTGPMNGIQSALGATIASDDLRGVQTATVALGRERVNGLQVGFALSYAKHLRGVQLGAVNYVEDAKGVQIGMLNLSRGAIKGVQIGLINYADEADASIGLVAVSKKHGVWFDLWTSDTQLIHAAVKFRARKTYSFFTAGIHPLGDDNSRSLSAGFGFGGPLVWREHVSLELDNVVSVVNSGFTATRLPYLLDTLRLSLAWRPARHFAIWGAVTANVMVDLQPTPTSTFRPGYHWAARIGDSSLTDVGVQIWPGFAAGFEF